MKFYVKKIWSLNPKKHKYITLEKAQKEYQEWLTYTAANSELALKARIIAPKEFHKPFELWLKTEI